MELRDFNTFQLDAIREVGNIGAGNAATALSKLLDRAVDMDVPRAELVSIYELGEHYGAPETIVAAVFVRSEGEFPCNLIFILPEEEATMLVDLLLVQQMGAAMPDLPDEIRDSALAEVGNIVLSSFLNAINVLMGTTHMISVPGVAHDMLGSILDVVVSIYGQMGDTALIVNTTLIVAGAGANVSGKVIMIPDPGSLDTLLGKLRVL
jgi:chemotaxis protein CheC